MAKGTVQLILEVNGKPASLQYQKLSKQLSELIKEQGQLNEKSKEYGAKAKEIKKVEAELKKILPTISNLQSEKRKLTKELKNMTIGSEEYIKTSERLKTVNAKLKSIRKETSGFSKEIKKASSATSKMKRGFSSLSKINPFQLLLGPIGLVIGAISALIGLFMKSERGARIMAKGTAVVNAVIGAAVKLVNDFIGVVSDIFTKSETPIRDLGKIIVKNILNRFRAAKDAVLSFGSALFKLVKGDLQGAKEAAKDVGKALLQVTTGLDKEKLAEVTKEVKKSAKAHINLALAKRGAAKAAVALTKAAEELATKEAILTQKADDATLSFKERTEAAQDAMKASELRAKKEIELAQAQANLLNEEIRLKRANGQDVNSMLEAQAGAIAAVMAAERELILVQKENSTRIRQLKQDELERNLDILIDGFDKQKTINERIIANEATTQAEKVRLLEETKQLSNESFQKQIETIQSFTGAVVDANDLINESDAVRLNNKIRDLGLSEIIEGRLLEIINERKLANLDLADVEQELAKAKQELEEEQLQSKTAKAEKEIALELELLEKKHEERKLLEAELYLEELENDDLKKEERIEIEKEFNQTIQDIEDEFLKTKSEKLQAAGLSDLEIQKQIAAREIEIAKEKSDKKIELEERTKAATEAALKQSNKFISDSFDFLIEILGKDEEARKKNAGAIKAFEIAKILTNVTAEVSSIWKNANSNPANAIIPGFGVALATAQSALAVGRSVFAISQITNQSFADGGFTGDGFMYDYRTGHRFAGMVHDGEYVTPKWQVNDPNYAPLIESLEAGRMRGYAGGGLVNTTPTRQSVQSTSEAVATNNNLVAEKIDTLIYLFSNYPKEIQGIFTYEQLTDILQEGQENEALGGI